MTLPTRVVLEHLDPSQMDLSASSVKSLIALADKFDLVMRVQGTLVRVGETHYESANKAKGIAIGDAKKPGYDMRCLFLTFVSAEFDFGFTAAFNDGVFDSAFVGGKRSGHRPEKLFTQITKLKEEIKRCLA